MTARLAPDTLEAMKAMVPEAVELLRQLGNPSRLLLLCEIAQQESSVADLERDLGMKQPGLSQQLAELRRSRLVKTRRESRSIHYSIADVRVQALLAALHDIFCSAAAPAIPAPGAGAAARRKAGDVAGFARVASR